VASPAIHVHASSVSQKAPATVPKAKAATRAPKAAATKAASKPRVASGTTKKTNAPKANNGIDVDIDSKDDSDIDAGSRGPKAKARAAQEDDDAAFEDGPLKKKAAPSGPKDASDQYQKVCSPYNAGCGAPLTLPDGF